MSYERNVEMLSRAHKHATDLIEQDKDLKEDVKLAINLGRVMAAADYINEMTRGKIEAYSLLIEAAWNEATKNKGWPLPEFENLPHHNYE